MSKIDAEIPIPPVEILRSRHEQLFVPSKELNEFVHNTFLNQDSKLFNRDHLHLEHADIGYLWTNVDNTKKGRVILGTAEYVQSRGDAWSVAKKEIQMKEWFEDIPDFIIILNAIHYLNFDIVQRCALIEHELYHCGQQTDDFEMPKFSRETGLPLYCSKPHDVEEFLGVVNRYGAYSEDLELMKMALEAKPLFDMKKIDGICGSCKKGIV